MRLGLLALLVCPSFAATIPTPESHFGHRMGADRKLLDWDKIVSYFQALEKSSDRIQVRELGKTPGGRPLIAVTISSPQTLRDLARYQAIQSRLADPRQPSGTGEGKVVVFVTCSIHADEVASTQTAVEFAWRLLAEDSVKFRIILDNVILVLVPSLNPDGVDIVTRWYRKTLGTPFEGTSPPELYQKYTGHDNNRDWYIFSQQETRLVVSQLHNVWHPQIVLDMHQQGQNGSRMFLPPWLDPIDPNVDPILVQRTNAFGSGMAADLTAAGKTGIVINALYDFWTPARHYQGYHGGLRILSEAASAKLATPIVVRPDQLTEGERSPGYNARERSWNYLEPWEGGDWRLRDIVDYQSIAIESCLYQAAVRRQDLLRDFYRIGQRAVARRRPYAFVVPGIQFDPGSARKMLETLAFGMVDIERANGDFEAGGKFYRAGGYVIRMGQPYSSFAKTLLERQHYPDLRQYPGGPPRRPYDVTAQTLPLLMGVEVDTVEQPFAAALEIAREFPFALSQPRPLAGSDIDSWKTVNQIWQSGGKVWRDASTGDFFAEPHDTAKLLKRARIGLYKSYVPSMDEGWTRWLLEQFGFAYQSLTNRGLDRLGGRYDAIVFPDQTPATIAEGYRSGAMPPEYTGGLGEEGAAALKQFVREGGTLVFLNHSTDYALEYLGVRLKNAVRETSNRDFYSPGSLLNVNLDLRHPLALGLPPAITIWSEGSPAWEGPGIATYPQSGLLASGWLLGEKYLAGKTALVDVPVDKGHIILFGMRPQYRAQSYQTFKLFFNALVL